MFPYFYPNYFFYPVPYSYYYYYWYNQTRSEDPHIPQEMNDIRDNSDENQVGSKYRFQPTIPGQPPQVLPPQAPGGIPGQFPAGPEEVLRYIEQSSSDIINTMRFYGIPLPVARRLIRRIIRISLGFCRPRN